MVVMNYLCLRFLSYIFNSAFLICLWIIPLLQIIWLKSLAQTGAKSLTWVTYYIRTMEQQWLVLGYDFDFFLFLFCWEPLTFRGFSLSIFLFGEMKSDKLCIVVSCRQLAMTLTMMNTMGRNFFTPFCILYASCCIGIELLLTFHFHVLQFCSWEITL